MKKLFNYALLAAALLIGVNVNAQTPVCELTMNGSTKQLTSLYDAFDSVTTAALAKSRSIAPEAYMGHEKDVEFCTAALLEDSTVATIKLLDNATLDDGRYVIFNAKKTKKIIYPLNAGERITLDLNGWTLTSNIRFDLIEASLYVINTNDDKQATINGNVAQFLNAYGSREKEAEDGFCRIVLGKNIVYNAEASNFGVAIFPNDYFFGKNVLATDGYTAQHGPGAGTVVDIFGEIRCTYGASSNGQLTEKEGNIPEINIHQGAKIVATNNNDPNDAIAIYAGGYAKWNINGYAEGATAIYIKAGEFDLDGATVVATGGYADPKPNGNGCDATGAAVVIDTHNGYSGGINVTIEGTTNISSANGYGIQEVATQSEEGITHCEGINIEGGSISGADDKGAITTTEYGKDNTVITGGTFNSDITTFLGETNIVTQTTDEDGHVIYVIGEGPSEDKWKNNINEASDEDYVKITDGTQTLNGNVVAKYLVLEGSAKVIIPEGLTLTIGEVVLSLNAQVIVNAGGYLIINDKNGIVANQASNLVFKAQEGKSAIFLMSPDVKSNNSPKATVEYLSKSYRVSASDRFNERFGVPTIEGGLTSVAINNEVPTQFYRWIGSWQSIGYLNYESGDPLDLSKMNEPFRFYQMLCNTPTDGNTLTMTGRVVGNSNPMLKVSLKGDNGFANSFLGNVSANALVNAIMEGATDVDGTIYHYGLSGEKTHVWESYNLAVAEVSGEDVSLAPMQAFYLKNDGASANVELNYETLVWNSMKANKAPMRNQDLTSAYIHVANVKGLRDKLLLVMSDSHTTEYERGYDAEKRMNAELNIFANVSVKQSIVATNNLDNTYVGFDCKETGLYSISFSNVNGESLVLVDMKTNARIEMSEGNTYEFLAEAGEDAYRFMIVEAAKAPTNTPATKAAVKATRALINGQIVISNGERFFNVLGADVK